MPKSEQGNFTSEFIPRVHVPEELKTTSNKFAIWTLVGDRFSHLCWLQHGKNTFDVARMMGGDRTAHFRPISFDDMGDLEKFLAPGDQSGHIVVAMTPYKEPFKAPDIDMSGWLRSSSRDSFTMGGESLSKSLGGFSRTDIVAGSESGRSQRHKGKLFPVEDGNPVIFDIQVIALDVKQMECISAGDVSKLLRAQYSE